MPSINRLPVHVQKTLSLIQSTVLEFDRYSFWIDHQKPVLPLIPLKKQCTEIRVKENRSIKYQPLWKTYVEIFQPTRKASQLLATAIKEQRLRTQPTYVEIAADYITTTRCNATIVRNFFLSNMLVPHAKSEVVCEKRKTFYFHRRTDKQGNKTPHVVVLYADKRSKLPGKWFDMRCCHLEHRFSGSDALSNIGINCIGDLAAFNHDAFWHQHLRLHMLPSQAELGRFLDLSKQDCSGTALRKRADKFLKPFFLEDALILQNVRLNDPEIDGVLRQLENTLLIRHETQET